MNSIELAKSLTNGNSRNNRYKKSPTSMTSASKVMHTMPNDMSPGRSSMQEGPLTSRAENRQITSEQQQVFDYDSSI